MRPFYVTTPIYYVNDLPHIGHIYTTVVADVLTRFHRLVGDDARFLTGTDEHGQNIEKAAAAQGTTPIALADRVVSRYHELWRKFEIRHDDFIRTTEARHRRGVEALIARIETAGDLYTARHEGWYCSSCEAFYTEKELDEEKRCPVHGKPCTWESEENVFFRLSKYAAPLLEHYESNPEFVRPETRRAEVVSFVRGGLTDLSVSRSKVQWGIPFPGKPGQVVYVWLDALTNYITALGFGGPDESLYRRYWDNPEARSIHLIGKDILRFHAVYWPAFLLSAGLPLPSTVFAHGWWLRDARKMSKSVGNVVRPDALVEEFGADALRYFLLREMTFGQDSNFSDEAFLARYNADLANDFGNTVSRVAALCRQAFGRTPNELCRDNDVIRAYGPAVSEWRDAMEDFSPNRALEAVWRFLSQINGYVVAREPWKVRKEEGATPHLERILYAASEGVRVVAVMLSPFMPATSRRVFATFGLPEEDPGPEALEWGGLPLSVPLKDAPHLFPRADPDAYFQRKEEQTMEEKPKPTDPASPAASELGRAEHSTPAVPVTPPSATNERISIEDFQKVRLVTGRVVAAERVPKSNRLLKLRVDLGGEERQLVAGIAARYEPETIIGRNVVVVANLKPARLMGVDSDGMVLAATVGEGGEPSLLEVDSGVPPGSRVK